MSGRLITKGLTPLLRSFLHRTSLLLCVFVQVASQTDGQVTVQMTLDHGVYTVPCKVNGLELRFIFDTGASDVSISLTEALFMLKNGYLSPADVHEERGYMDATGRIGIGTRITLRRIEFAGLLLRDVSATVVQELNAPLLLGQSAMRQLGRFELDLAKGLLILKDGAPNAVRSSNESSPPQRAKGPAQESPVWSGRVMVTTLAPILDRPDFAKGATIGACEDNRAEIIRRYNDEFYYVGSGAKEGYLHYTWIKGRLY